jgi:tRNA pseudouridine55 synthase
MLKKWKVYSKKYMRVIKNKISSDYNADFASGEIILIDKMYRKSSFDIVHKIRKAVGVKKVGHAGTLDPLATGLVIICTGKMTKRISEFQVCDKTYTGIISIGKTTPSFDLESGFDSESDIGNVTEKMIYETAEKFKSECEQTVPMFSAIKHKGKSLYKFARKGIEVEREPRKIFINYFEIKKIELPDIYFEISCSKGTYIRVIADDFGKALGCGAYLKELRRTKVGDFRIEDALSIEEFKTLYEKLKLPQITENESL